jgi:hypothetical protein
MAETVPLPRPRPSGVDAAPAAASQEQSQDAAAQTRPEEPPPVSACFARLRELAVVKQLPDIKQAGGCGATDVVQLEAVLLPDNSRVTVEPAPTIRCEMASALTDFVRDELAPAVAASLGSTLRAIENFDAFSCRGRNRVVGARLSEHGKGNALDVRSFKLADGTSARPTDPNVVKEFREQLRKAACGRFTTVLGPGSDGYHEDHIHLDLAQRRNDYRLCQWAVRQPVHRVLASPHIVSDGKAAHAAPQSLPASPVAASAAAEEKPRGRPARRL